ncbi:MAG: hypothetical protein EOO77_07100 [Oxalobacteraceae bacterium]|nr:MAG: hypothetical protein EOO77_07100 [Oxalobacteraceae bacterium]
MTSTAFVFDTCSRHRTKGTPMQDASLQTAVSYQYKNFSCILCSLLCLNLLCVTAEARSAGDAAAGHAISDDDISLALEVEPLIDNGIFGEALARHHSRTASQPNIVLLILDTLRADHVTSARMPRLHALLQKSLSFERVMAAATSTDHAMYAMLHMRPAYERELRWERPWHHGSVALQWLKRAGYSINLFTFPAWYACPPIASDLQRPAVWGNQSTFELLYQNRGQLLERCPHRLRDQIDTTNPYLADAQLVGQYLEFLDGERGGRPRFDLVHLYGAHDPYGVSPALDELCIPSYSLVNSPRLPASRSRLTDAAEMRGVRNTYINAVRTLDQQVGALIDGLKSRHLYEDCLIVVASDHGETLPEPPMNLYGHGLPPTWPQSDVILSFKFPHQQTPLRRPFASSVDLFPTVFAHLGLTTEAGPPFAAGVYGTAAQEPGLHCAICAQPKRSLPPTCIAVSDGSSKLFLEVAQRGPDERPTHWRLTKLTDMQDRPLCSQRDIRAVLRSNPTLKRCLRRMQGPNPTDEMPI